MAEAEQQLRNALFADLDAKQALDWRDDRAAATELLGPTNGVVELAPERLDAADVEGVRAHLDEHGFACIRGCASAAQLDRARGLLWDHLEGRDQPGLRTSRPLGWRRGEPETWRPYPGTGGGPQPGHSEAGLMTSTTHCDALWYIRSLPGVLAGFACAFGTPDLVCSFDRMSINLPTSSAHPAAEARALRRYRHGMLDTAELHNHLNRNPFGEPIYYGLLSLWDMNKAVGTTGLVPGSHRRHDAIKAARAEKWRDGEWVGGGLPGEDLESFTESGLTPSVLDVKAGDLVVVDSATYHCGCSAEDPSGESGNGRNELLRAICIMAMAPSRLLSPTVLAARRLAFEHDVFTGGSCGTEAWARRLLAEREQLGPRVRELESAPEAVRRLVDPSCGRARL